MRRTGPVVLIAATLALGLLPACSATSRSTKPLPVRASQTPTIHPTPDPSVDASRQVDRLATAKKVGAEFGIAVERATGQPKLSEAQAIERTKGQLPPGMVVSAFVRIGLPAEDKKGQPWPLAAYVSKPGKPDRDVWMVMVMRIPMQPSVPVGVKPSQMATSYGHMSAIVDATTGEVIQSNIGSNSFGDPVYWTVWKSHAGPQVSSGSFETTP